MGATYRFGRFELNPATRQLLVDRQPALLGARALDVLLALIERRDRLVTKNELLDLVWPGLVVEENNLQVQISALRKLLGHDVIATVPGRGYRFTLEPTDAAGTQPGPPPHAPKHNLPEQVASFIGREREIAELRHVLAQNRLVTLVGVGGVGKTQALQAAAEVVDAYRDGVWLVELGSITDPSLVPTSVAHVLGVPEKTDMPLTATLCAYLKSRQTLLILDNCEHLKGACASLANELLRGAPEVKILATSREGLHIRGEQIYPVLPTRIPGRGRWQRLTRGPWRWLAAGIVGLGIAGVAVWTLPELWKPKPSPISPSLISVGVMPFVGPPGDAAMAQEAEALTRDFTTRFVLTSIAFRVVPAPVVQTKAESDGGIAGVARTLNVRYVIEGQIRPSQDGTLISLRLMNGATGEQIGSETVSLKENDTARDQTRALNTAVNHLKGPLFTAEKRRVMAEPLAAATPMDLVMRGWALTCGYCNISTEPDTAQAARREGIKLYEEALRRDPNLVLALWSLAGALGQEFKDDIHIDRERALRRIDEITSRELNLAPSNSYTWDQRAWVLLYMGQWDASLEASARALQVDPENSGGILDTAWLMINLGRPAEALALVDQAIAMDPSGDVNALFQACRAHLLLGQYELAIAECERAKGVNALGGWVDLHLAAAYALRGDTARAATEKAEVLRLQPGRTIANLKNVDSLHPDYVRLSDETIYAGLRKAGFPEK
jgi:DNA-binding winged helix-turn-helix (wHTH) protein/tetratricopeptide (TPR) repeat protein